jgi:hypothetical protein
LREAKKLIDASSSFSFCSGTIPTAQEMGDGTTTTTTIIVISNSSNSSRKRRSSKMLGEKAAFPPPPLPLQTQS